MTQRAQKYTDWAAVIACNFMWATQVSVVKIIGDRLGPVAIAFVPMFASTALFFPVLWRQNRKRGRGLRISRRDVRYFLVAGLMGPFLIQFTYVLGAQRTLAANAGIITLTIPVFVAIAASLMLGERMNPVRYASFAIALTGVLMTSVSDLRGASFLNAGYLVGNLLFLTACASSAFYNTFCKFLVDRGYTELEILVYSSVVGSAASIPLFLFWEPLRIGDILHQPVALWAIVELALIVYGLAMLLFFYVLKRLDVTQASLGNYLLPFFIALIALAVLREKITVPMALGGAVTLLGTLLVTVYERRILEWFAARRAQRVSSAAR
ncbi:MAG: DMT family transporter [Bryobacteraceae bacterium]|nr:DMT family transporter [Bryobacteraceae bacterium]